MTNFSIGDTVTWSSSAGSSETTKKGTVVAIVPADVDYYTVRALLDLPPHRSMFGGGMRRDHESYIVSVPHKGKGMPALYWPRVATLQRG